jgi:hypothetical protein
MTFLIIMVAGLIGLLLMALPGIQQHGHAGVAPHITPHAHTGLHLGHSTGGHGAAHALPGTAGAHAGTHGAGSTHGHAGAHGGEAPEGFELTRLIPSPRAIFSMLTLFGAFGYAFLPILHSWQLAALAALVPAWAIEYFAVRPLWNAMFQFQGKPTTPIEALVTCDATAVTPFRNGKGLVSVEHDGRVVQFSARLQESHAGVPVKVGDTLCVEEVDAANQRVMVSVR